MTTEHFMKKKIKHTLLLLIRFEFELFKLVLLNFSIAAVGNGWQWKRLSIESFYCVIPQKYSRESAETSK